MTSEDAPCPADARNAERQPLPLASRQPSPGTPGIGLPERAPSLIEAIALLAHELRQTNVLVQELLEQNHALLTAMAEAETDPDAVQTIGLDGKPIKVR